MKILYHTHNIALAILVFVGCQSNVDKRTLKLAHTLNEKHPVHLGMVEFAS